MGLIYTDFAKKDSLSGIWEMSETEDELLKLCNLTDYDKSLLADTGSKNRKIEILAVRALLYSLNPDITIQYDNRKPLCNKGYISISHSDKYAAVIWHPTNQPTVDIEHINQRILRISKRAFNDEEIKFAKDNIKTLTTIWSCKECVYKIANIQGLDFKKQIFVSDFTSIKKDEVSSLPSYSRCLVNHKRTQRTNTKRINCLLKLDDSQKIFNFKQELFDNHVLVWG